MTEPRPRRWRLRPPGNAGIRARLYLAMLLASVVMLPVVVLSLYYDRGVGRALDRLHAEVQAGLVEVAAIEGRTGAEAAPDAIQRDLDARLAAIDEARARARTLVSRAQRNVVTVLLVTLVAVVLVLMTLPGQVMRPLRRILNVVRRASHGDYAAEVHLAGADELGQTARELNRLLDRVEAEREAQQALLRAVRRDLDLLGRGVDEAICIVDSDLVLTYANAAFEKLVGADGDLSAERLADWIPDEGFLARVREALRGGSLDETVKFEDRDGESQRRRLLTAAGYAPDGHVDRAAVVLRKAGLLG